MELHVFIVQPFKSVIDGLIFVLLKLNGMKSELAQLNSFPSGIYLSMTRRGLGKGRLGFLQ